MSGTINMDWERAARTGLGEAVFGTGKSAAQLQEILQQAEALAQPLLFTRLDAARFHELQVARGTLDFDAGSGTVFYLPEQHVVQKQTVSVAVVTGGSADIPVAREAVRTLAFHGIEATEIYDVGVAGLWRIQARLIELRQQQVIICIAGMDAALPTVLAGLVPAFVIAVPVSTGYGMARDGETALHALLCSCAQGMVVVNIDNGFGAACAALRSIRGRSIRGQNPIQK
jgi:hypothetical protein